MADSILPVPLNRGVDLVTPPLMIEPGALISCLNYEMTDTAGYRRIDGYEQYDGYPNGDLNEYYVLKLSSGSAITVGAVIYRETTGGGGIPVGVVLENLGGGSYAVAVYRTPLDFVSEPNFLNLSDGVAILLLSTSPDALLLHGAGGGLTDNFYMMVSGSRVTVTVGSIPVSGKSTAASPSAYLNSLRQYSTVLRNSVGAAPGAIAGLFWFHDRLLAAVNTLRLRGTSAPVVGTRVLWNGAIYTVLTTLPITGGGTFIYVSPTGTTHTTVDNTIQNIDLAGTLSGNFGTANPLSEAEASSESSEYAYIGYFNNPAVSSTRGFTTLTSAHSFTYNNGNHAGALPPPVTRDTEVFYYIVGAGPTVLKVKLTSVTVSSGSFNGGSAVGNAQIEVVQVMQGVRNHVVSGDVLHSEFPTTASSAKMTLTSNGVPSVLAGTALLDAKGTRYVWGAYNFYGQSSSLTAYGTNGAGRAFWATSSGFGNITAVPTESLDTPKYLAYHANKLALGFQKGSVLLSVVGEPYNFQGQDGAKEVATGDNITGLLETQGDTLTIFGRTSIRKITGTTSADIRLGTISGNAGAFDYTAVLVGSDAVFAGINGISTLEQTAAYGDFVGKKLSGSISSWLRPKLASSYTGFEQGGAACAFAVRSKNQYRLVLRTGEVVVVTFTDEGPKITFSNWTTSGNLPRIPYAWSSELSNDNKERIHIRWEGKTLSRQCFQLDSGWGFNGLTFNHHFTTAHIFNKQGSMYMGVEKVRLYGQGHGVASLNIKSSGIEKDFEQDFHKTVQDISMPAKVQLLTGAMRPVTSIVDQANWGLGIKLQIQGNNGENTSLTEPAHICQVLVLHTRTEGATDG